MKQKEAENTRKKRKWKRDKRRERGRRRWGRAGAVKFRGWGGGKGVCAQGGKRG